MKSVILVLISCLSIGALYAQKSETAIDYQGGNLTFQFYERGDVKVPHGKMEYSREEKKDRFGIANYYIERGENKDGNKNGEWTIEARNGNRRYNYTMNYADGMLEGPLSYQEYSLDKKGTLKLEDEKNFTFHNGCLVGENVLTTSTDTLYCNYDDNGKRIGEWKLKNSINTRIGIYKPCDDPEEESVLEEVYEVDVLGQKLAKEDQSSKSDFHMSTALPLIFFRKFLKNDPTSFLGRDSRVELPTLHENKTGISDKF